MLLCLFIAAFWCGVLGQVWYLIVSISDFASLHKGMYLLFCFQQFVSQSGPTEEYADPVRADPYTSSKTPKSADQRMWLQYNSNRYETFFSNSEYNITFHFLNSLPVKQT